MNPNLKKYKVIPSVVEAEKESTITIKSIDGIFKFFDDVTYEVTITPQDISDVPLDENMTLRGFEESRKKFLLNPQNGELKIKYFFSNEQEWRIHISSNDYKKHQIDLYEKYSPNWGYVADIPQKGIDLFVYSLKEDLYKRRALKGDLHIHTSFSDGQESPEMVSAFYRKGGHDFIAITDHNIYNASKDAKEKLEFVKNFDILCGEEVHNGYRGFFHMVNLGSRYSVNEIYLNEPERVNREIAELEKTITVPDGLDKKEYLNRVWIYQEIKKSGGYAIFPHPYWNLGFNHTSTPMSKAIIKNGLCDAFEVLGGCKPKGINLQVALYNDLRAEGCDIPIVASTDSHSVLSENHLRFFTIAFSEEKDFLKAIDDGYSVAVEVDTGDTKRIYGKLRLASFAHFLLENYYPLHNELCQASGLFIEGFIHGDEGLKELIEKTEEKILEFENEFFGR